MLEAAQILSADFTGTTPDKASIRGTGAPWILAMKIEVDTTKEAINLERKIKKRGIRRFLEEDHNRDSLSRVSRDPDKK